MALIMHYTLHIDSRPQSNVPKREERSFGGVKGIFGTVSPRTWTKSALTPHVLLQDNELTQFPSKSIFRHIRDLNTNPEIPPTSQIELT